MRKLPRPYPDELVGSVLVRGMVRSGLPFKRYMARMTGRSATTVSFFLPSDLGMLSPEMGLEPYTVLWHHTAFPYISAFMLCADVARLARKALSQTASTRESLSSLVQSVTQGVKGLRFCAVCRDLEMRQAGESYWHRAHNLPGVEVCHLHDEPLHMVPISNMARAFQVGLPHHKQESTQRAQRSTLLAIVAARSAHLLKKHQGQAVPPLSGYRSLASEKGYALSSAYSGSKQVSHDLRQLFGCELLERAACPVDLDASTAWPAQMLRPGTKAPFAPVKHVLLTVFLEQARGNPNRATYVKPGKRSRDYAELDALLVDHLHKAIQSASALRERKTVEQLFDGSGLWSAYRHCRTLFPLARALIELEYRSSNVAERQSGRRPYWRKRLACRSLLGSTGHAAPTEPSPMKPERL